MLCADKHPLLFSAKRPTKLRGGVPQITVSVLARPNARRPAAPPPEDNNEPQILHPGEKGALVSGFFLVWIFIFVGDHS